MAEFMAPGWMGRQIDVENLQAYGEEISEEINRQILVAMGAAGKVVKNQAEAIRSDTVSTTQAAMSAMAQAFAQEMPEMIAEAVAKGVAEGVARALATQSRPRRYIEIKHGDKTSTVEEHFLPDEDDNNGPLRLPHP